MAMKRYTIKNWVDDSPHGVTNYYDVYDTKIKNSMGDIKHVCRCNLKQDAEDICELFNSKPEFVTYSIN